MAPSRYDAVYDLVLLYARTDQVEKASALTEQILAHAGDAASRTRLAAS